MGEKERPTSQVFLIKCQDLIAHQEFDYFSKSRTFGCLVFWSGQESSSWESLNYDIKEAIVVLNNLGYKAISNQFKFYFLNSV